MGLGWVAGVAGALLATVPLSRGTPIVTVALEHRTQQSNSSTTTLPALQWEGTGVVAHSSVFGASLPGLPLDLPGVRRSELVACDWEGRLDALGLTNQSW